MICVLFIIAHATRAETSQADPNPIYIQLINMQNDNGSWGSNSIFETSLAVYSLMQSSHSRNSKVIDTIGHGMSFIMQQDLTKHKDDNDLLYMLAICLTSCYDMYHMENVKEKLIETLSLLKQEGGREELQILFSLCRGTPDIKENYPKFLPTRKLALADFSKLEYEEDNLVYMHLYFIVKTSYVYRNNPKLRAMRKTIEQQKVKYLDLVRKKADNSKHTMKPELLSFYILIRDTFLMRAHGPRSGIYGDLFENTASHESVNIETIPKKDNVR